MNDLRYAGWRNYRAHFKGNRFSRRIKDIKALDRKYRELVKEARELYGLPVQYSGDAVMLEYLHTEAQVLHYPDMLNGSTDSKYIRENAMASDGIVSSFYHHPVYTTGSNEVLSHALNRTANALAFVMRETDRNERYVALGHIKRIFLRRENCGTPSRAEEALGFTGATTITALATGAVRRMDPVTFKEFMARVIVPRRLVIRDTGDDE